MNLSTTKAPAGVAMNTLTQSDHAIPTLTPTQAIAFAKLEEILRVAPIVALAGATGSGRTRILRALAARHGGTIITALDMAEAASHMPADQFEDAIGARIIQAIQESDLVVVDDLQYWSRSGNNNSIRPGYYRTVLRRIVMLTLAAGKSLVLCGRPPESWESAAQQFGDQAALVTLSSFTQADYAALFETVLGAEKADGINFGMLYRYSSYLNGYQLSLAAALVDQQAAPDCDSVIQVLEAHVVTSNTRVSEVENISFAQLPGHEHIIESLEANIILPLENRELAHRLGLRPKRGVLLFGPPGTGKTSIGRALAHRMSGKFFLIDGSIVSEPPAAFFGKFQSVVQEAKDHAPSVLFIDDADVLFKIDHIAGLSRYLLSLLDGLESGTSSNVCVMMTAMSLRPIPEALLRSGRIELWLETSLPDEPTRARIIQRWMGEELPGREAVDPAAVASITEGFTPADLRRLIGDAKALYASDLVAARPPALAAAYLERAVAEIVAVRNRMADGMGDERLRLKGGRYPMNAMSGQCGW